MTDRSELAKLVSRSIALTGPIWQNVPVNLCPDDDPPGEPRPMKAAPVNNLTPFIDAILESDWLQSIKADAAASALRDFVSTGKFGREFFGGPTKAMVASWAEEEAQSIERGANP